MKHLLLPLLFCASVLHAEVLLTENFDFTAGDDLLAHGWLTTWGTETECGISISNGLTFADYPASNIGNGVVINCKSSSSQPHLAFTAQTSGSVWVAFMCQPTIIAKSGYFFFLRDALSTTTFNMNARLFISDTYHPGIAFADNAKVEYASLTLNPQTTYLFLVEYQIVPGSNNDSVSLYVFDTMPAALPAAPAVGPLADTSKPDIDPENLGLRGFDTNSWISFDGLRIATTWFDALGINPVTDLQSVTPAVTRPVKTMKDGQLLIHLPNHQVINILGSSL